MRSRPHLQTLIPVILLAALGAVAPALAMQTWDLAADSLAAAGSVIPTTHGQWSHGYAANMGEFSLCDMAYYGSSNDGLARWIWSATNDGGSYSGCPMQLIDTNATGPTYGLFYPGKYYCHGGDGTDQHPFYSVMRWTAPEAGLYSVSAALHAVGDSNPAGVSCGIFVDSVNVLSGAFSVHDPPLTLTGAFSVADAIDLDLGPDTSTGAQWTQVDFTITEVPSGTISGTVKAADPPGQPGLAGATVRTDDSTFSTLTDQQGAYSLRVSPGSYTLEASKPGYLTAQGQVTVEDGQTVPADFELATLPAMPPVVNEIQSANSSTIEDEDGDHPDWIELYNPGGTSIDLLGYGLSDDTALPFKWTFPSYDLQPGQYLLVFASDKDRKTGPYFHTNYAIKSGGEPISLTAPNGTLASRIPATAIPQELSYGCQPDGSGSLYYFAIPTPGRSNSTTGYIGTFPSPPVFSRARGFYNSAFNLTLSTTVTDAVIRYTTDGSQPTEASPAYSAPIAIQAGASGASLKTTPVRARLFKTGFMPSTTATNTYFVGPDAGARYNLPVVSLVTTRANFFDPEIGIYVYGNHSNYNQDGPAWERPIHVEFFEPGGACGFHCDAGVRIHGGGSVYYAQKSLRLYSDNQGGPGSFDYQIFPESTVTDYKRIILRNGGQDIPLEPTYAPRYTMIHDGFAQSLISTSDVDAQLYRPGLVFFNGEYWGIFEVMEREDKYWIANRHPEVDPDNIDLIQQHPSYYPEVLELAEGDMTAFNALRGYFQNNDLLVPANYDYIKTQMEISSLLIHHIANIYYGNTDWPGNNIRYWRPRTPDGKWRWAITDCDISFAFWNPASQNTLSDATSRGGSWPNDDAVCVTLASLLRNREARDEFINRTADMLNTVFNPSVVMAKINALQALLSPNVAEHFARWGAGNTTTWNNNMQTMKDFINARPGYLRSQYAEFFRLSGMSNVTLNASSPSMGTVTINTIDIPSASLPWQGTYFQDIPIKLTAVPAAGYRFVRWDGAGLGTQNPATVVLSGDATITAVFNVALDASPEPCTARQEVNP